jgi:hypothetical protein
MFDFTNDEMMKKEAEHEARKILAKMMSDAILKSDAPESKKLVIRVLNKAQDIQDALSEGIANKYCTPGNTANTETLKKVLEYLELVETGIKQFAVTTPFVANTEEE